MFLVTYHPATLDERDPVTVLEELLAALDRFPDAAIVFTKANADAGGRAINARLESYVGGHVEVGPCSSPRSGSEFYLAALKEAAVVIGNSSSGIIEAPAAGTPDGEYRHPSAADDRARPASSTAADSAMRSRRRSGARWNRP